MDMSLFTISLILFLIMDPLGNVSSFLSLVRDLKPSRIRQVIAREMLIALALMILFHYLGEWILSLLDVSPIAVRLASSVILFLTAIKILFPSKNSFRANLPPGEPFLIPLAVPLIAGPSLLATIMLFAVIDPSQTKMLTAIFFAWGAAVAVLSGSQPLYKYLGKNGLVACERLTGMLLVMLAVQRFTEGLHCFIDKCYA